MTAKASASAFNSFFYQQQQEHQKHQQNPNVITNNNTTSGKMDANGVGGGGGASFSNSEPVHDLHLKMSKKIAQLTKVRLKFYNLVTSLLILKFFVFFFKLRSFML